MSLMIISIPILFMGCLVMNVINGCRYIEGHDWQLIDDDSKKYIKMSQCKNCGKTKNKVMI